MFNEENIDYNIIVAGATAMTTFLFRMIGKFGLYNTNQSDLLRKKLSQAKEDTRDLFISHMEQGLLLFATSDIDTDVKQWSGIQKLKECYDIEQKCIPNHVILAFDEAGEQVFDVIFQDKNEETLLASVYFDEDGKILDIQSSFVNNNKINQQTEFDHVVGYVIDRNEQTSIFAKSYYA